MEVLKEVTQYMQELRIDEETNERIAIQRQILQFINQNLDSITNQLINGRYARIDLSI